MTKGIYLEESHKQQESLNNLLVFFHVNIIGVMKTSFIPPHSHHMMCTNKLYKGVTQLSFKWVSDEYHHQQMHYAKEMPIELCLHLLYGSPL